ncbi:putative kinase [Pseudonocardia hierapolitana]|uniref:Putative kinase n=1 Tax=Pseudonocardia hierapolitana TaxID=1128676 RepID=A0A561SZT5_9PSEU|nr:ATP-binding protein [Pseudonocardia hierapolitana]TWF80378.1 putative kinase [Pseudonocardia hierapolitana]
MRSEPANLLLMVGLPGAGKTIRAQELAAVNRALRLTPDEWMISLFDGSQPDGKRDLLEGQLIALALQALQLGTNVVLDFGLWSRDERSALRWLATSAGASCRVVYLPVDKDVQRARIAHRQATAPHTTFPMNEADIDEWRKQFQAPDAAELGRRMWKRIRRAPGSRSALGGVSVPVPASRPQTSEGGRGPGRRGRPALVYGAGRAGDHSCDKSPPPHEHSPMTGLVRPPGGSRGAPGR